MTEFDITQLEDLVGKFGEVRFADHITPDEEKEFDSLLEESDDET